MYGQSSHPTTIKAPQQATEVHILKQKRPTKATHSVLKYVFHILYIELGDMAEKIITIKWSISVDNDNYHDQFYIFIFVHI